MIPHMPEEVVKKHVIVIDNRVSRKNLSIRLTLNLTTYANFRLARPSWARTDIDIHLSRLVLGSGLAAPEGHRALKPEASPSLSHMLST